MFDKIFHINNRKLFNRCNAISPKHVLHDRYSEIRMTCSSNLMIQDCTSVIPINMN